MTGTITAVTPAPHPPAVAPVMDAVTVRTHAEAARAALVEAYTHYRASDLAPRHKGLVRLLLESADDQLRGVEGGLHDAWNLEHLTAQIRGAIVATQGGDADALQRLRDPSNGHPIRLPNVEVATRQVAVLIDTAGETRKTCALRLPRIESLIRETTAVLADRTSTDEDLVALVRELQGKLEASNLAWAGKLGELERRVDEVLAKASSPKPPAPAKPQRRTPRGGK